MATSRSLVAWFAWLAGIALICALSACAPVTIVNAITPEGAITKTAGIAYGTDSRNRLDVYTPKDAPKDAPAGQALPVVVFLYGGSWNTGRREDYLFAAQALASRGMVVVVPDYRLYPQVRYPAFVQDTAKAVAWTIREIGRFGGDPSRVFLMGHSAGAYNVAMVALDGRWLAAERLTPAAVRGWIGVAGPYDFIPVTDLDVRPVFFYPDTPPDSQPINHVTPGAPPALLLAPGEDEVVDPRRNTGGLAAKLRSAGIPVTERYFASAGHVSIIAALAWPLRPVAPVLDAVSDFVQSDRRLAGTSGADGG